MVATSAPFRPSAICMGMVHASLALSLAAARPTGHVDRPFEVRRDEEDRKRCPQPDRECATFHGFWSLQEDISRGFAVAFTHCDMGADIPLEPHG